MDPRARRGPWPSGCSVGCATRRPRPLEGAALVADECGTFRHAGRIPKGERREVQMANSKRWHREHHRALRLGSPHPHPSRTWLVGNHRWPSSAPAFVLWRDDAMGGAAWAPCSGPHLSPHQLRRWPHRGWEFTPAAPRICGCRSPSPDLGANAQKPLAPITGGLRVLGAENAAGDFLRREGVDAHPR